MQTTQNTDTQTPETPDAPEPETDDAATEGKVGREAARYRRQLRDAEAKLDALEQRVATMQRADVERIAGHLSQPAAIWAAGVELDQLLDDEGNVDPELVTPAITQAAERLGLAHIPGTPQPDPTQGATATDAPTGKPWVDAMQI